MIAEESNATSALECARDCYKNPHCLSAGFVASSRSCLLTTEEPSSCGGDSNSSVQTYGENTEVVFLECITCDGHPKPAGGAETPTPTPNSGPSAGFNTGPATCSPGTATFLPHVLSTVEQEAEILSSFVVNITNAATAQNCIDDCAADAICNSTIYIPSSRQCYLRADKGECSANGLVSTFNDTGDAVWFECLNCPQEGHTVAPNIEATPSSFEKTSAVPLGATENVCGPGFKDD